MKLEFYKFRNNNCIVLSVLKSHAIHVFLSPPGSYFLLGLHVNYAGRILKIQPFRDMDYGLDNLIKLYLTIILHSETTTDLLAADSSSSSPNVVVCCCLEVKLKIAT